MSMAVCVVAKETLPENRVHITNAKVFDSQQK